MWKWIVGGVAVVIGAATVFAIGAMVGGVIVVAHYEKEAAS